MINKIVAHLALASEDPETAPSEHKIFKPSFNKRGIVAKL
jgi:hypothetical protein